jgi:hypothetical protein
MNIKTTLILAATAVVLLSAPASARTNGSAGWASAFPDNTGGHVDHPSYSVQHRQHRYSQDRRYNWN